MGRKRLEGEIEKILTRWRGMRASDVPAIRDEIIAAFQDEQAKQ